MKKEAEILDEARRGHWLVANDFSGDIHELARDLLGRVLLRRLDGAEKEGHREGHWVGGTIVELEVYLGTEDRASHARSGRPTERNWPMFGPAGLAYVYKIYGMYHCLNVSAPPEGGAGAILIRALEPIVGLEEMARRRGLDDPSQVHGNQVERAKKRRHLTSGPGKLCQALGIDRQLNGVPLSGAELGILAQVRRDPVEAIRIGKTPRIGLNPVTCGPAATWPWRYVLEGSAYLSR